MSAPERICIDDDPCGDCGRTFATPLEFFGERDGFTIYVRADLHDTLRAERDALAARVERLEGALRLCPPNRPQMTGDEFRKAVDTWWALHARAALSTARDG
jgi:hypothetical protein